MVTDEQEGRKAGRPRSMEARQAILDATLSLLATQGFDTMSIEEVAVQAGVGRTTIYRWWDSKEALALEALQQQLSARRRPIIDTGDFRHDLIVMLEDFIQILEDKGPLLECLTFKLLGDLKTHPQLFHMFYSRLIEPRLQQFSQMIERAQARGELRQDLDPFVIYGLFGGAVFYRMLLSGEIPLRDARWQEQIIDAILNGVAIRHES
ncbi:MAG TPA: TetR/AcrR family transcriptional regulator [Ktedonosporobacter sp.]|nr:TetR/AcrR family transcriptional regulator [Ktedonosporobacter sp.]